jgi:hypothetical protein
MQKVLNHIKKTKFNAISTIEIILSVAMFSIMVLNVSTIVVFVIRSSARSTDSIKAMQIASEGLEVVRDIKNANFSALADGTYGIGLTANRRSFNGTSDVTEKFTRQVVIMADAAHSILPDVVSKKITVTVSWGSPVQTYSVSEFMTNWERNKPVVGNWALPTVQTTYNATGTSNFLKSIKKGNYLYAIRNVTTTANFIILDVSNLASPTLVLQLNIAGIPSDMEISGNYIYVASSDNTREISVVNITVPTSASVLATYYNAPGNIDGKGLCTSGNRLYFTQVGSATPGQNEFAILNITTPTTPTLIGSVSVTSNPTVNDCYIRGNYAYLATALTTNEISVINMTTESAPTNIGVLNLPITANATAITGFDDKLLVGSNTGNFYTISIATATVPSILGTLSVTNQINQIQYTPDYSTAFLGTSNPTGQFRSIDISTINTPTALGSVSTGATTVLNGIFYDAVLDRVFGSTNNTAGELVIIRPT